MRRFQKHSDEIMAWWVQTLDRGFDPMCLACREIQRRCPRCDIVTPETEAAVRAEFARRSPNAKARPTKTRRGTK
jgi:hypothetical protein